MSIRRFWRDSFYLNDFIMWKRLVSSVVMIKNKWGCNMYHLEMFVVAVILLITLLITQKWYIEWIWTVAVFLTFWHASVANRLEESEWKRQAKWEHDEHGVWCWYKLQRYYYAKEICWTIYFILLWARSALVGVVIFLLYWPRRKVYRKYSKFI